MKPRPPLTPWDGVDSLSGIGPTLAAGLTDAGAGRVVDLLLHLPSRYEDRTRALKVEVARDAVDSWVLIRGGVSRVRARRSRNRRLAVVEALVADDTGALPVVWFNQRWIAQRLKGAEQVYLYGQVRRSPAGVPQLVNPEVEEADEGQAGERVAPVYGRLGPISGRRLRRVLEQALGSLDALDDPLPERLRRGLDLPDLAQALRALHAPSAPETAAELEQLLGDLSRRSSRWHRRLALDELLAFTCGVAALARRRAEVGAIACRTAEPVAELARTVLPFLPTPAQERALEEIAADLARPRPMARLLQGDVGCGKTAVAALAMLVAVRSGAQAAMMAPTELLAEQHWRTLSGLLGPAALEVGLLTSSRSAALQREVRGGLASGRLRLVVGTHALIQSGVEFERLGLAVVDEQHRFGVAHRQALLAKGVAPHLLVMTATPIPRSLALTVYGDLDLTVIDQLPPGRQPVTTLVRPVSKRPELYDFLRRELDGGGRAYVVCPLIEPSERLAARALGEQVRQVRAALPGVEVGVLHGRLSGRQRDAVAAAFRRGEVQVVVATSLVEVGVDVPEASVMVVESPERFGLSQLHQLRGRIGRGSRRSFFVLLAEEPLPEEARRRLELLCRSSDGFALAEADLALRGPGELTGTRQWGVSGFRFADLVGHRDLVEVARRSASELGERGELEGVLTGLGRLHRTEVEIPAG